jgi:CBS domain-containing protein
MDLLKVARVPAILASPAMMVADAVSRMVTQNVGAVAVANPDRYVVGIFTERDVLRRVTHACLQTDAVPLCDVMTTMVETATPETKIEKALERMIRGHFRHLPIVDTSNRVIGIVSVRYLLMRQLGENRLMRRLMDEFIGVPEQLAAHG